MKRISLLTVFLFMLSLSAFAQKPGTADYLLVKRGFKIFKLGESIEKYSKYVKFDRSNDNKTKEYTVIDPKFLTVGEDIRIDKIILKATEGKILFIKVIVDDIYNLKFYSALKAAYGDHDNKGLIDIWITSRVWLTYKNSSKENKAEAIFIGLGTL